MKQYHIIFLALLFISAKGLAMAKAPLAESPSNPTAPSVPQTPAINSDIPAPQNYNVFTEVAYPVGEIVDSGFQSFRDLLPQRNSQQAHGTDQCDLNVQTHDSFADRISYAVELKMHPSKAGLGYVGSYFGLSSNEDSYFPNSLISHPLCNVSADSLDSTLGGRKIPNANTIKKINEFANRMNQYRQEAINGNQDSYVKASRLWSKLMMCMSYTESLTTADLTSSQRVAQKYAPAGYRRPANVLFYEDPYQSAASRLNIGLFQFTPNSSGNIQACIREWNSLYPRCSVSPKANQSELIKILGSSLQTFNAFCGIAKVTGVFAVQINTNKAANTHPANVVGGKLKNPDQRCVSPHFAVGKSYNHFGPFQNSTGSNLNEVMSCTLAGAF